jgi:hypothetical protein
MVDPYGDKGLYTGQVMNPSSSCAGGGDNNKAHGKGTMKYEDGRVYVGTSFSLYVCMSVGWLFGCACIGRDDATKRVDKEMMGGSGVGRIGSIGQSIGCCRSRFVLRLCLCVQL